MLVFVVYNSSISIRMRITNIETENFSAEISGYSKLKLVLINFGLSSVALVLKLVVTIIKYY